MTRFLKTSSRLILISALLILSIRPSAVNCPNPVFVHAAAPISSKLSVSAKSKSEQIFRRCSFMKVETQSDRQLALAGHVFRAVVPFAPSVNKSVDSVVVFASGCSSASLPLRL